MKIGRYRSVKAEWMTIKKDLGTMGFLALILSMIMWLIFGILNLYKTLQMRFTIQETVILYNVIFFTFSLVLAGFLYIHVLKIKNRKLKFK